jgi:hypothetical protein
MTYRVQEEVSDIVVHQQFKDRIDQILQKMVNDMDNFVFLHMDVHPSARDVEHCLEELASAYITLESSANYRGQQVG